jgi:hypothetical protein
MDPDMSVIEPPSDREGREAHRGSGPLRRRDHGNSAVIFDVSGVPVTRERVRKTRRWMLLLLLTPLCLFGLSVLAFGTNGPDEPVVHPRSTPRGWQAITDSYFGYAVPASYTQNTTWTDQDGDFFYGREGAFVAETESILNRAPTATAHPPPSFRSAGEPTLVAYTVGPAHRVTVAGTRIAFEEQVTRPGGWKATAIDAWQWDTTTQVWLLIHAPASVTGQVMASFQG